MANQTKQETDQNVSLLTTALLGIVKAYRYFLSPLLPGQCRFYPSCSNYSIEALKRYGALTGLILTIKRLLKCHPWGDHGIDMVPDLETKSSICKHRKP